MRRVFFSFDWDDVWHVNQIRHSWVTKGSYEAAGFIDVADIEGVKKAKDYAIKNWIDQQLNGTSVSCVLIGSQTANSRWVLYEIKASLEKRNGLLGVYIHNVKDQNGDPSPPGKSPIHNLYSSYNYVCPHFHYDWVCDDGYNNLGHWIEQAAGQAGR